MGDPITKAKSIFLAAIEDHAPAEWPAFLDKACNGDCQLRAEVEKLLQARAEIGSFHEDQRRGSPATVDDPISERPGTVIGPYKLLEQIGEGGMGLVFIAEQREPIKRRVALKVIKPGMDSRQVIARFEAERQALALMDHPHIAKVHDGGTTPEGRPYFVMELVKGTPITEYCDQHRMTTRQRLHLFLDVCHAVQHAHQKGIIHRDLKPSNVLVEIHDVQPVVKIIDFGIAKATGQQLTDKTVYTAAAQMVGTPMYMSPEQAGLSSLDVDTRSDVYSLGVLLYELLTGTPPFDHQTLKKAGYDEMRRIIREEEPPRPSGRLSTLEQAALSTIAEKRGLEPRRLSQQLRGELDWIIMKALEKDRTRRFESASAFAADVQRYLDDEPVLACPPSRLYRLGKLVRRHKVGLGVGAVLLLAVVALGGGIGWVVIDRSSRQAVVAARVTDALGESERLYRAGKVPEALNVAQHAESLLATGPADETLAARVQERVEDLQMVLKLEEVVVAPLGKQGAEYEQLFRRYGIDLAAQPTEEIAARIRNSFIASDLAGMLDQMAIFFSIPGATQNYLPPRKLMAVARQADPDPWRDRVRQAIERGGRAALEEVARTAPIDQLPPVLLRTIGFGLLHHNSTSEQPLASLAREFLRRALQRYPGDLCLNWLLENDLHFGAPRDLKEAAGYLRTLVALRPNSVEINWRLGNVMYQSRQYDDSILYFRKVIEVDPQFFRGYINIALSLAGKGQMDEAEVWLRKAIDLKHTDCDSHYGAAQVYAVIGRWDDAITECREAIRLSKSQSGNGHEQLAIALAKKGRYEEAIAAYQEGMRRSKAQTNEPLFGAFAWLLATAADAKYRDPPRAVAFAKKAVEQAPREGGFWNTLGVAHYRAGDWKAAIGALKKSDELDQGQMLSFNAFFLAMAHWRLGEKNQARQWYDKAVDWMDKNKPKDKELKRFRAETEELLGIKTLKPAKEKPATQP